MKVVLFCGGLGMRIRDFAENIPKPMITLGYRPILWHLMKYYSHYGHRDFILCLGYRGDVVKEYFLRYSEAASNDFILSEGGRRVDLLGTDISDWRITFVDTGQNANLGERLRAVRPHLEGEQVFLANYADGLTDLRLPDLIDNFQRSGATASFLSVRPPLSYHFVATDKAGKVTSIDDVSRLDLRINAGFFTLRREIFDVLGEHEELVQEPFRRLLAAGKLMAYPYDGFWMSMDTFKDKQRFDELLARGGGPWEVWNTPGPAA